MLPQQQQSATEGGTVQVIGLHVGTEQYGLPISAVQEIVHVPHITRVPRAPHFVRGVVNLRGNVIPVVDIARRLSIGETLLGETSRIVIVEVLGELIGLGVEQVSRVRHLSRSSIKPLPAEASKKYASDCVEGVALVEDQFLVFLNLSRLLAEEILPEQP